MKKILLSGALFAFAAAPALANSTVDAIVDNTLVINGSIEVQYNADGTYSASDGTSGAWSAGDEWCVTPDGGDTMCGPIPPDGLGVGDSWEQEGADGATMTFEIK